MRRVRALAASLLLVSAAAGHAVDLEDILRALLDQALTVRIVARVTQSGEEVVESYELTRVTISGRAVRLRLEGGNVTIIAEFTPYEDHRGFYLVASGQILLRTPDAEEVLYVTSIRSVPVEAGEKILFYPLGRSSFDMDVEGPDTGLLNIELEIQVSPYRVEQG